MTISRLWPQPYSMHWMRRRRRRARDYYTKGTKLTKANLGPDHAVGGAIQSPFDQLASKKHRRYYLPVKFRLMVEFDPEAKRWSAVFPELPGCATAGDTEAEAIANAQEALALWFEPAPIKLPKGAKMIELAVP